MLRLCVSLFCAALLVLTGPAKAQDTDQSMIDLQVRLAWAHASPGPIDGRMGKNTRTAIKAFQRMRGLDETGEADEKTRQALPKSDKPTLIDYEITEDDVDGPFIDKVPDEMEDRAKLERLSYTSPRELLAEKFHMYPDLLQSLNEGKSFDQAGTTIRVANVADLELDADVKRIEVDKKEQTVRAYDADDKLVAAYPSTVGSDDTPSPEGKHKVVRIARGPTYTYDPEKLDFKGVKAKKFTIPAGPNNPVGMVWIELDAPGYGIHGSPEPTEIRRESSHGCVRLTNWDALQLADAIDEGVPVAFVPMQEGAEEDGAKQDDQLNSDDQSKSKD